MGHDPPRPARLFFFAPDRWVFRIIVAVLATYVLEGPTRFLLVQLHAEMFLYLRDGVMAALIAAALVSREMRWLRLPLLIFIVTLCCHTLIGVLTLPSPVQALIGAKIFLPLVFGAAISPLVRAYPAETLRFIRWTFWITVLGIIGNRFVAYPWVGMSYSTAAGSVELSRAWTFQGELRIPGFTRASFVAAGIVALALYPAILATRNVLGKWLVAGTAFVAIALTTSKGPYVGMVTLFGLECLWRLGKVRLWALGLVVLATACLALPLLTTQLHFVTPQVPRWQLSFYDRIQDMWPRSLSLLTDPLEVVWGRGLGGIGVAQRFTEPSSVSSADNLMLYLFVTFGGLGVVYVAIMLIAAIRCLGTRCSATHGGLIRGWLSIWFGIGLTANMIEDMGIEIAIGIVFGLIFTAGHATETAPLPMWGDYWTERAALPASGWSGRYG